MSDKLNAEKDKIIDAHCRASNWLYEWNRLEEQGKTHTKLYEEAQRKAQYWLDRLNDLERYSDDGS